jgi:sigma-B regulation protein RsbU (phosphoserine phosphatase)
MSSPEPSTTPHEHWQTRLAFIVETMREMSSQTEPQEMVKNYAARMRQLLPRDGFLSLSRRGLESPSYRITRSSTWEEDINPWKQKDRLPLFDRGILGELIYANEPRIINDFQPDADDPAFEYLDGMRSLSAIPQYDRGEALNMIISFNHTPDSFDPEEFPELVWMSNLFGRATHNLVLHEQLDTAYKIVDQELKVVADIQRSLLPSELPNIPGTQFAAHYQTSRRAGGDYYDFFPLPDGQWGILIADVSGHGTPAAVLMAVTHSIAHTHPGPPTPPGNLLAYLNAQLCRCYIGESDTFVTAFYGIYDPRSKELTYSSAGHLPPRVRSGASGSIVTLAEGGGLPLGIDPEHTFDGASYRLASGDRVLFYTDGITEAESPTGEMFGTGRLDEVLLEAGSCAAQGCLDDILQRIDTFTAGAPAEDDRTLLVADVC